MSDAVQMVEMKFCSKCDTTKPLNESFYVCRSRKDGHSAWCKGCSNKERAKYTKVRKTVEYRAVARAAAKGKPTTCPDCGTTDIPSRRMRGRIDAETGVVQFSCFTCVQTRLLEQKAHVQHCGWCSESFTSAARREFCDNKCLWSWFNARRNREDEVQAAGRVQMEEALKLKREAALHDVLEREYLVEVRATAVAEARAKAKEAADAKRAKVQAEAKAKAEKIRLEIERLKAEAASVTAEAAQQHKDIQREETAAVADDALALSKARRALTRAKKTLEPKLALAEEQMSAKMKRVAARSDRLAYSYLSPTERAELGIQDPEAAVTTRESNRSAVTTVTTVSISTDQSTAQESALVPATTDDVFDDGAWPAVTSPSEPAFVDTGEVAVPDLARPPVELSGATQ